MHPIESILETTMTELKHMVDVNTIVGDAFVTPTGCTIIPISKVSFGFVTGGGQYGTPNQKMEQPECNGFPFAGGSASGITIAPVAFMVAEQDSVKLLAVNHRNAVDKLMENIPQMIGQVKQMVEQYACGAEAKCGQKEADNQMKGQENEDGQTTFDA